MQTKPSVFKQIRMAAATLLCVAALAFVAICALTAMPLQADALEVTSTTAKSNADGDNSIQGGMPTRVTWEAQSSPDELITQIVLDYPAGSEVKADLVKVTGLSGLTRMELGETVTQIDGDSVQIDFPEPVPGMTLIRVEAGKTVLPAEGGSLTVTGSFTTSDGTTASLMESPAIEVIQITGPELVSAWLAQQGWVQTWNENKLLHLFFDPTLIVTSLPTVAQGWLQALLMVAAAFPFAIVLGLMLCFLRISGSRILRAIGSIYVNVVRGTPLFLQIYIAFFGLPLLGIILGDYTLSVIVMGLNSSAYLCEIFRAGIESIHKGQFEASRSLGMNAIQTMFFVIIPQAFRRVIPTMTSEFILLYKDTSLFAAVGVMEMIMYSKTITAATGNMTPYIVAAFFYLLVTLPLTKLVGKLEKNLSEDNRSAKRNKQLAKQAAGASSAGADAAGVVLSEDETAPAANDGVLGAFGIGKPTKSKSLEETWREQDEEVDHGRD